MRATSARIARRRWRTRSFAIRLELGKRDIVCGVCERRKPLIDPSEDNLASDSFLKNVRKMDAEAQNPARQREPGTYPGWPCLSTVGEAGHIFRPVANSDWGIDGEIEFKNDKGEASGERLYLQLKSGHSYLHRRKADGRRSSGSRIPATPSIGRHTNIP